MLNFLGKSCNALYLCNPRFSWWEIAQVVSWPLSSRSKICLLQEIVFKYFIAKVFGDSGAQFLANYLEKNCYSNKQERFEFNLFAKSKGKEKEEKNREQEN